MLEAQGAFGILECRQPPRSYMIHYFGCLTLYRPTLPPHADKRSFLAVCLTQGLVPKPPGGGMAVDGTVVVHMVHTERLQLSKQSPNFIVSISDAHLPTVMKHLFGCDAAHAACLAMGTSINSLAGCNNLPTMEGTDQQHI